MMTKKVRVRYAPSPTGYLHIGNARTAMFNYLFAKHHGGDFIIRIEDTDAKRNVADGEESQFKYLKWLGLDWAEGVEGGPFGPYRQSERLDIYQKYTDQLMAEGKVYKCYCSSEELEAEREAQMARGENPIYSGKCRDLTAEQVAELEAKGCEPSIRFKVPAGCTFAFDDIVKGHLSFDSKELGDWVIVKKDGIPTYNYAVVVDDHLMEISHVFRGEEHISNTPRQLMLFETFGWDSPVYAHMSVIVNENKKKLSKRDGSIIQFIHQYAELGYLPEAMFNFMALLGWHPGGEEEILSMEDLIRLYDADRLSKSPAFFDKVKLEHINNVYMKKLDDEKLVEVCLPHLVKAGKVSEELTAEQKDWVTNLITMFRDHLSYGAQIVELSELFFGEVSYEEDAKEVLAGEQVNEVLNAFLKETETIEFVATEINAAMKRIQKETGHRGKMLFMPVRSAIFGQVHGPDLMKSIELLGREKVTDRIKGLL